MIRPKKVIVATAHQEFVERQREVMDAYMEEHGVFTRTAVIDEALFEFYERRGIEWPRSYGQKSGVELFAGQRRRRSDQRIAG